MIVVTTPTGNIGSKLVPLLLNAGESVRVIARDPAKLSATFAKRVEVVQGSADDANVVNQAFAGAKSVFWVVPPSLGVPDVTAYYVDFTRTAAAALRAHKVPRVVSVSSLGRYANRPAGVASSSHAKDDLLDGSGASHRGLWAPGFMENVLMQLQPLRQMGTFFLPSKADLKIPHAATRDIAASAAKLLCDTSWTGPGGLAVLGPEDLSPNDMAHIMSDVLERPIHFQEIAASTYQETLMGHGASAAMAKSLTDLYGAVNEGLYHHERRTPQNTTPTFFREWCVAVLRPAFNS